MRIATFAAVCAALLVLAGFAISRFECRMEMLAAQRDELRLQVASQQEAIETLTAERQEAERRAERKRIELEEVLAAVRPWGDACLPPDVVRMFGGEAGPLPAPATGPAVGN